MLTWKALHVLSMVTMITVFIGAELFYAAAIWRRDVHALAFIQRTLERAGLGLIAIGALIAGIIFGLMTVATGGFDVVAGWLIAAYVLVAAFLVNAFLLGDRIVRVGKAAIEAEQGARPMETVLGDLAANRGVIFVAVNTVIFGLIVIDMVLKPF